MNLRAYHVVTVAFILSAVCWAHEQGSPSSSSEESDTGPATSSVDSLFANPRVCFDRTAPGDQFFREVLRGADEPDQGEELPSLVRIRTEAQEPFELNPTSLALLASSDQEAATKYERIQREMAELIAEHPTSPAAREVEQLLAAIRQQADREAKEKQHSYFISVVPYTR